MSSSAAKLDLLRANVAAKKRNTDLAFLLGGPDMLQSNDKAWYLTERGLILNQLPCFFFHCPSCAPPAPGDRGRARLAAVAVDAPARPRPAAGQRRPAGGASRRGEEQAGHGGAAAGAQGGERGAAHHAAAAGAPATRVRNGEAGVGPGARVPKAQGRQGLRAVRRGGPPPLRRRGGVRHVPGQGGRVHGVHEVVGSGVRRVPARERATPRVATVWAARGGQAAGHPEAGRQGHQVRQGGAGGGEERERHAQGDGREQGHRRQVQQGGAGVPPGERGRGARQHQGAAELAGGHVGESHPHAVRGGRSGKVV
ncbi:uncharacterized protein [Aegilops tauschii subsp. strangulata]|uniref:uncharacterized protein n=1 Tax=Aegilops tauschii subsp. strangulata TaxID=200361 RepID=UPI00098A8735|nr:spidroin-1-like [Aegilops tauschii subsp. strangulata]